MFGLQLHTELLNEENKIYGLYLQKCDNEIIKKISETQSCKSEKEVEEFFRVSGSLIIMLML